jgi:hypothetical protein
LKTIFLPFAFFFLTVTTLYSQTATIKGTVKDQNSKPIENVSVKAGKIGTTTDKYGAYYLEVIIPKSKKVSLTFSHVSYNTLSKRLNVRKNGVSTFSPKLSFRTEEIKDIIIDGKKKKEERKRAEGTEVLDKKEIENIPSINDGVTDLIKTIGTGVNNSGGGESSTYNVRGGNYDENLVYVNGIEVYRPFLVRSGQQEGLSFVNSDMTKNVEFSSGGFQAKYGDKLSSVLDITYRKPTDFGLKVEASLLGASATVEGNMFKDKKLSAILGVRYRNNSLIVNSKDIESNYKPSFTDVQTYLSYKLTDKLNVDFLGNFALNNYKFTPYSRVTKFSFPKVKALVVHYNGKEVDKYLTSFGALKFDYKVSDKLKLDLTSSVYNTQEEEHYDINAFYSIGDVNADFGSDNFGNVEFAQSIGSQLDHARNDLDALISNISLKAQYKSELKDTFLVGLKYQHEDIQDRIIEWEVIDSAGFSIRPPELTGSNDEPYNPYTGSIVPFNNVSAENKITINRISGFAQWSKETYFNDTQVWFNVGVRSQTWSVSGTTGTDNITARTVFSPRAQFSFKPDWKRDMLFRISGGYYHQPPFYKELRDENGEVHDNLDAQQAIHFVIGNDYNFTLWERPFKLVTEAYYKSLTNVNPFTIDNVQIRYAAKNNAVAYATGLDARISGEFVPGTESYFTFGLLQTKENIDDKGYIYRPTDQRLKLAILFQDYLPKNKNFKMYLNMVYNTGVPGGSPLYADPYEYQNRLKDYFRSDIGMNYIFIDAHKKSSKKWLKPFKELSFGIELFNMFDVTNSITNTWVRDVSYKQSYAIPNYLSGRLLNTKLSMRF